MTQYLLFFTGLGRNGHRRQISAESESEAIAKGIATGYMPYMIAHEEYSGAHRAVGHRKIEIQERRMVRKQYKKLITQLQTCSKCKERLKKPKDISYHMLFAHSM